MLDKIMTQMTLRHLLQLGEGRINPSILRALAGAIPEPKMDETLASLPKEEILTLLFNVGRHLQDSGASDDDVDIEGDAVRILVCPKCGSMITLDESGSIVH